MMELLDTGAEFEQIQAILFSHVNPALPPDFLLREQES